MKKTIILASGLLLSLPFLQVNGQDNYHIAKTFHIASSGGWDYLSVGPGNNRLYVSHGNQVNILDLQTGDSVGIIPNTNGVHGIAFDAAAGLGFTSNGRSNNVSVFNLQTSQVLGLIPTGENPDAIMYDPFTQLVVTCNGRSKDLSVIDPIQRKVIATIAVAGKPETAVSDNAGHWFVNIEDKSSISSVNAKTYKVEHTWKIAPGESPTGLAIDKNTKRLFAGCEKLLMVINAVSGKMVAQVPIGNGCDGVAFDDETKTVFTSNGEGTLSIIKEISADQFTVQSTAPTKRGARTIALDPVSHAVFLPTADFETPDPKTPNARPKPVGGTFQIVVVQPS